mgnify:CR=1 FL=1
MSNFDLGIAPSLAWIAPLFNSELGITPIWLGLPQMFNFKLDITPNLAWFAPKYILFYKQRKPGKNDHFEK